MCVSVNWRITSSYSAAPRVMYTLLRGGIVAIWGDVKPLFALTADALQS